MRTEEVRKQVKAAVWVPDAAGCNHTEEAESMAFVFQGSFSTNYAIWRDSSERPLQIDKQAQSMNCNISVLLLNLLQNIFLC